MTPILSSFPTSYWRCFKQQRLGYLALRLLFFLLLISIFAEFIVNDKPLLIYYNHHFYSPLATHYSARNFGRAPLLPMRYGDLESNAILTEKGWMLWPISHYNAKTLSFGPYVHFPSPPSAHHWLGTTTTGQDVFAVLVYGFRSSLLFTLLFTLVVVIIGVTIGACLGYYGGSIDLIGQHLVVIGSGPPHFFLLLFLAALLVPNLLWLLIIMALLSWMPVAKSVRVEFLQQRQCHYVLAAQALGVRPWRIIFRHILPNALVTTLNHIPFLLCSGLLGLTSLDFLGVGLPSDTPSLGNLLWQGKNALYASWISLSAVTMLMVLLMLLFLVGDALRALYVSATPGVLL